MRKILPVINQSTGICPIAARAAQIVNLTLITFDQAEEQLETELKEKGMRMSLAKINELKKDFVRAIDEALRLGLPVNDYAARDAAEFGLNIPAPKNGKEKTGAQTPFENFQKY